MRFQGLLGFEWTGPKCLNAYASRCSVFTNPDWLFDFHMQVFKVRARKFNYQYLLYFTCKSYKTKHRHGVELPALDISA